MEKSLLKRWLLFVCLSWQLAVVVLAQATNNGSLGSAQDKCVGVFVEYALTQNPVKIHPYNASNQPYSFESNVTLTNYGYKELKVWELAIDFQYDEVIAQADGVTFLNALTPPGTQTSKGTPTKIIGSTTPNLLTSIDTAADLTLISTNVGFKGTEFGVGPNGNPLPANMSLVNDGYTCAANNSAPAGQLWVCCTENQTAIDSSTTEGSFSARQSGDIIMSYDIVSAATSQYTAQVSILMNDPIGRLDFWNLTWQWTGGEFINSMKGAQVLGPNDQDLCVYGEAAQQYADTDFSNVMSCSVNPVLVDLQPWESTDTTVAIPYCCRNGTLLSDLIDPSQSRSDFQLEVYKLPPHNLLDDIIPPSNWNIGEGYTCTQPSRVSPAEFYPDALHSSSAVASWQVICNVTLEPVTSPKKCCVSFSAYYNNSVIPCPTCSCGCSTPPKLPWNGDTCNANVDALLLPSNAVLLPPSNRTVLAQALARADHYKIPQDNYPLPCPDNCGVSINWHVYSDYSNGWSARMTLLNWDTQQVVNWSSAVQMPQAMPGFQQVYSFNGTIVPEVSEFNNTLFMQGHNGYNNFYLLGKDSKDNPGKLQSVLSFDKRKTPGINVPQGGGYPSKVWFNGEECRIPDTVPAGDGFRLVPTFQSAIIITVTIFLMVL